MHRILLPSLLSLSTLTVFSAEKTTTIANNAAAIADEERKKEAAAKDGRNIPVDIAPPESDPELAKFAIQLDQSPRPEKGEAQETSLPLELLPQARIAYIGGLLLDNERRHGFLESFLHQKYSNHKLEIRNFTWPADEIALQPRPDNFGDLDQHLFYFETDVIIAAFGTNESFAGREGLSAFEEKLDTFLSHLTTHAYNGESGPQVVLLSPTLHENKEKNKAGDRNNENLKLYAKALADAAQKHKVAFVDVLELGSANSPLTSNGSSLNEQGQKAFAKKAFQVITGSEAPEMNAQVQERVIDKATQFAYRYRPLNTFYYTGGRNENYGYLDFLPAMRNFDLMVESRNEAIWKTAAGNPSQPDDSHLPDLGEVVIARGANEWLSPADEQKAFDIDPRFEISCFASEEDFPELACPIQIRWDARGRLWVSCSTTYPHVYPGQEPSDKLIILEDTDQDGRADKCTTFADDLHIPLAFTLDDKGGVYLSEQPHLTYLHDSDGDDKADSREILVTGFGCEDSHHSLHDFVWTPGGHLLFRESIFHNTQVETPYGPVRAKNSSWFLYHPETQKLTAFGAYPNTNPWGVVYDRYGNHMASHPVFAASFHATNPAYPGQHPPVQDMQAYSGTCGQDFIEVPNWPAELQGTFVKARYKPDNRIEIHKWIDKGDHFAEEYVSDLIFSTNLSFIPVDLRFGPDDSLYICDWYNPVKGHAQYSLRDPRRDRKAGRIWRVTPKENQPRKATNFAEASLEELLEQLQAADTRTRHWAKRALRSRDHAEVKTALDQWITDLDENESSQAHALLEALWVYQGINQPHKELLTKLTKNSDPLIAAAALGPIRFWYEELGEEFAHQILADAMSHPSHHVQREAGMAASYVGTNEALQAVLPVFMKPASERGRHLSYALATSVNSELLSQHWNGTAQEDDIRAQIFESTKPTEKIAAKPKAAAIRFDQQAELLTIEVSCVKERLLFTKDKLTAKAGQPIKLIFKNPDATHHNIVLLDKGTPIEEIGSAANEMAKTPAGMTKHFVPKDSRILKASKLLPPGGSQTIRFRAPKEPGVYPYLCTFPGHWILMKGELTVE